MVFVSLANKVFQKLETIPMYNYPNFLNLLTTFACESHLNFVRTRHSPVCPRAAVVGLVSLPSIDRSVAHDSPRNLFETRA